MSLPDFFVIGAPKAGTTALHAALGASPAAVPLADQGAEVLPRRRPAVRAHRGPGDAHSAREWVWRRSDYEALFADAPPGAQTRREHALLPVRHRAHDRIHRLVPHAKLVAILRDPVDRGTRTGCTSGPTAWSPSPTSAPHATPRCERIEGGWGLFWHYRRTGLYGEQLEHLYSVFRARAGPRVAVSRTGRRTAGRRSTGSARSSVSTAISPRRSAENTRPFVRPGMKTTLIAPVVRAGASVGRHFPPAGLATGQPPAPGCTARRWWSAPTAPVEQRRALVGYFADDIRRLELLTGASYADWLGDQGAGEYSVRSSWAPSDRVIS